MPSPTRWRPTVVKSRQLLRDYLHLALWRIYRGHVPEPLWNELWALQDGSPAVAKDWTDVSEWSRLWDAVNNSSPERLEQMVEVVKQRLYQ